jgi:hypothetical protein
VRTLSCVGTIAPAARGLGAPAGKARVGGIDGWRLAAALAGRDLWRVADGTVACCSVTRPGPDAQPGRTS